MCLLVHAHVAERRATLSPFAPAKESHGSLAIWAIASHGRFAMHCSRQQTVRFAHPMKY